MLVTKIGLWLYFVTLNSGGNICAKLLTLGEQYRIEIEEKDYSGEKE